MTAINSPTDKENSPISKPGNIIAIKNADDLMDMISSTRAQTPF